MSQRFIAITNLGRSQVLIDKTIKKCGLSNEINTELKEVWEKLERITWKLNLKVRE